MLIDELPAADLIVIGVPMHNFGVGMLLRCYIDQIARACRTCQFILDGPHGLVTGKRVVVMITRGSDYSSAAMAALDLQRPYLQAVFRYWGIEDVAFISCEGMDTGKRERSLDAARYDIPTIVAHMVEAEEERLKLAGVA